MATAVEARPSASYCCSCFGGRSKKQQPQQQRDASMGPAAETKPGKKAIFDFSEMQGGDKGMKSPVPCSPMDVGDVVLKLKDNESKFDRRQKYQSMFKDAPLYQVYDDRNACPISSPKSPIARVTPGVGERTANSLEFTDDNFTPIDSDEQDTKLKAKGQIDFPSVSTIVKSWKDQAHSNQRPKSLSPRRQSPSPPVFDSRLRASETPTSVTDDQTIRAPKKPVKRAPSDPSTMQAFVDEFAGTGPNRAMWSLMPQVVSRGLMNGLSPLQRKLQEALFEMITSEASYYRSLNVLIEVFYKSPFMQPGSPSAVVSHTQKHHLFSNILDIHLTSENLLRAMEACFREDPWLVRLCDIIYDHTEHNFDTYMTYMQNQMFQHRTLENLKDNLAFTRAIKTLQTQPECAFLNLSSFLILPTQRIPRMCLLMTTMLNYAPKGTLVYRSGLVALAALDNCAREGEAMKLYMEQKERLMHLAKQFEYKFDAKSLATENRRLIKEGEFGLLTVQHVDGSAFRRRLSSVLRQKSVRASLFLFNDLLVIAKKRRNNRLSVDEYCSLSDVKVEVLETPPKSIILRHYPTASVVNGNGENHSPRVSAIARKASVPNGHQEDSPYAPYPFRLIIQSETHPRAEYILQAKTLSERERWVDAISATHSTASDDLLIRDCPQVLIIRSYLPIEGDELELKEGDSASLLISLSDGWCKGMLPGGKKGWFPDNVCVEVQDDTVKHENVKKFLLMEEARNAYKRRKAREHFVDFQKVTNSPK